MLAGQIKKIVLAYSGGLDTSIILKWLQENYDCEVVTFTADLGQGEELEPARQKAEMLGIKEIFIDYIEDESEFISIDFRCFLSKDCKFFFNRKGLAVNIKFGNQTMISQTV